MADKEETFTCQRCGMKFNSQEERAAHNQEVHGDEEPETKMEEEP